MTGPARRAVPRLARALVRHLTSPEQADFVLADLDEDHAETLRKRGRLAAWLRYWRLAIGSILAGRQRPGVTQPRSDERHALAGFAVDIRYAVRTLRKTPGFTLVAVLTLAIGIGANIAIFSVLNGVLLRPLPYDRPQTIVNVWQIYRDWQRSEVTSFRQRAERFVASWPTYREWRARSRSFAELAAYTGFTSMMVERADAAEWLPVVEATATLPAVLGVEPAVGRWFRPDEDVIGGPRVAVLSDAFARRWFGDPASAPGQAVRLSGTPYLVIGVMPRGFYFPERRHEVWIRLGDGRRNDRFGSQSLEVVARLRDGVTVAAAQTELSTIADQIMADFPQAIDAGARVVSRVDDVAGDTGRTLALLMMAVGLVLIVATANVTGLILVRTLTRRREVAVRLALGARRSRVWTQMMAEGVLLATAGGSTAVLGLAATFGGFRSFVPAATPRIADIAIDWRVFLFAASASVLVAAAVGGAAAIQALRADVQGALRDGSPRIAGSLRGRSALVITEVAVAVVLLTAAALLLQSYVRLRAIDLGFNSAGILTAKVTAPRSTWTDAARQRAFFDRVLERASALPGVMSAGFVSALPMSGGWSSGSFGLVERPTIEAEAAWSLEQRVTAGYFTAMGIPLRRGRFFGPEDGPAGQRVMIVNERLVRQYFPDRDPIGQVVWEDRDPYVIIGIVGDIKHAGLIEDNERMRYWSLAQRPTTRMDLVVRTGGDPRLLSGELRRLVLDVDPLAVISSAATMTDLVSGATALPRFRTAMLGVLAVFALALSALGIYGVIAFTVSCQARDIGVRMSLGATRGDVARQVLASGVRLIVPGLFVGLTAALIASRSLEGYLFETAAMDPVTLAVVATSVGALALLATAIPARRAARVDPLVALKADSGT